MLDRLLKRWVLQSCAPLVSLCHSGGMSTKKRERNDNHAPGGADQTSSDATSACLSIRQLRRLMSEGHGSVEVKFARRPRVISRCCKGGQAVPCQGAMIGMYTGCTHGYATAGREKGERHETVGRLDVLCSLCSPILHECATCTGAPAFGLQWALGPHYTDRVHYTSPEPCTTLPP